MSTAINSAAIAERLDILDAEQARREREIETAKDDLVTLDRQRAQLDVERQLDGLNVDAVLKDVSKQRGVLLGRLDALTAGLQQGHFERDELAKRLEDAKVGELRAEHERMGEAMAGIDDRMAEYVMAMFTLQREAQAVHWRDQDLVAHPLLQSGPKRRPLLRAVTPFALGVPLHPSTVAQAEQRLAELRGRGSGAA